VLVESGNVLISTSNFWRYSNTSIRSTNMEVKKQPEIYRNFIYNPKYLGLSFHQFSENPVDKDSAFELDVMKKIPDGMNTTS